MRNLVVLSGAGISKESGIPTFRDNDGLWKHYRFEELANPEAWNRNPSLVLDFYNFRRKIVLNAEPNSAHKTLADLENLFKVTIITQNVDDLHERAGSKKIIHLHGEILKARSTADPEIIVELKTEELNIGDLCPLGSQLRPHIVWFGEPVPNIEIASKIIAEAEIFIVIGTSLKVYPAANLIYFANKNCNKYLIDPSDDFSLPKDFVHIKATAVEEMKIFKEKFLNL